MHHNDCSYETKDGTESIAVKNGKLQIFGEKNYHQHKLYRLLLNEDQLQTNEHGFTTLE
jgi:hypothetical protein